MDAVERARRQIERRHTEDALRRAAATGQVVFTNRAVSSTPDHARRVYLALRGRRDQAAARRRRQRQQVLAAVIAVGLVLAVLAGWWLWRQVHAVMTGDVGPLLRLLLPSMLGGGGWVTIRVCRHKH